MEIHYRPGAQNGNADGMSRRPQVQVERLDNLVKELFASPPSMPEKQKIETECGTRMQTGVPQHISGRILPPDVGVRVTSFEPLDTQGQPLRLISKEQEQDPCVLRVRRWVFTKDKPCWDAIKEEGRDLRTYWRMFDDLSIQDDTLVRKWTPPKKNKTVYQQVVLPGLRAQILDEIHNGVTSAHFGRRKTLGKAKNRFYWPGMVTDVIQYCRTCPQCEARRKPCPKMKAPLQSIKTSYPFQLVATDITELPISLRGNRYCIVIGDHFT